MSQRTPPPREMTYAEEAFLEPFSKQLIRVFSSISGRAQIYRGYHSIMRFSKLMRAITNNHWREDAKSFPYEWFLNTYASKYMTV
jgi:hypothetical protein